MVEPIPFPGQQRQKQIEEAPKTVDDILEGLRTRNAAMRKGLAERRDRRIAGEPGTVPKAVPAPVGDRQAMPLYVERVMPFAEGEWRSLAFYEVEGDGRPGLMDRLADIPRVDRIDVTSYGVFFRVVDGPDRDDTILAVMQTTSDHLRKAAVAMVGVQLVRAVGEERSTAWPSGSASPTR